MRVRVVIDDRGMAETSRRVLTAQLAKTPSSIEQELVWWQRDRQKLLKQEKLSSLPAAIKNTPFLVVFELGRSVDVVVFISDHVILREGWWMIAQESVRAGMVRHAVDSSAADTRLAELDWLAIAPAHPRIVQQRADNVRFINAGGHANDVTGAGEEIPGFSGISEVRPLSLRPWYNRNAPLTAEWEASLHTPASGLGMAIETDVRRGLVRPSLRLLTSGAHSPTVTRYTIDDIDSGFSPPELRPADSWKASLSSRRWRFALVWSEEKRRLKKDPRAYLKGIVKRTVRAANRLRRKVISRQMLRTVKRKIEKIARGAISFAKSKARGIKRKTWMAGSV